MGDVGPGLGDFSRDGVGAFLVGLTRSPLPASGLGSSASRCSTNDAQLLFGHQPFFCPANQGHNATDGSDWNAFAENVFCRHTGGVARRFKNYVAIAVGRNYAEGNAGYARNSADAKQRIDCFVQTSSGTATVYATCMAADASGSRASWSTTELQLVSMAQSAVGDSCAHFMFDTARKCTEI